MKIDSKGVDVRVLMLNGGSSPRKYLINWTIGETIARNKDLFKVNYTPIWTFLYSGAFTKVYSLERIILLD